MPLSAFYTALKHDELHGSGSQDRYARSTFATQSSLTYLGTLTYMHPGKARPFSVPAISRCGCVSPD